MRPLELSIRDFRSYSGEHQFDFRGRRLIAIVGPTGAGKSTILDAITFALYGSTPRTGMKNFASLINQRATEAMVSLRFETDGREWEATRSIRRKGGNQYVLSSDDTKLVMAEEINSKVKELLGLDYDAFTRSVLLAQGKFAEFLEAGPAKKVIVLKGLLNFERLDEMQKLAKQRSTDIELKLAVIDGQLKVIAGAKELVTELQDEFKTKQTHQQQLQLIRPKFEELNQQKQKLQKEIEENRDNRKNIKNLRLPDHKKSEKTIQDAEQAESAIKEAEIRLEKAHQRVGVAEQSLQSPDYQERLKHIKEADRLVIPLPKLRKDVRKASDKSSAARHQQEQATGRLEQSRNDLATAEEQLLHAEEERRKAKRRLELAEESLSDARHQDMAAELRSGLEEGGDCPVCEQPVHEIPAAVAGSGVEKAEKERNQAKSENEKATKDLTEVSVVRQAAVGHVQRTEENLKSACEQVKVAIQEQTELQQELEQCLARLEELLGAGDPQTQLEEAKASVQVIQDEANQAVTELKGANGALKETRSAGDGAQRDLGDLWKDLAVLAPRLEVNLSEVSQDDPQAIRQLLTHCQVERTRKTSELEDQIQAQQKKLDETNASLKDLCDKHGVESSVGEALAAVVGNMNQISKGLVKAKKDVAEEVELVERKKKEQSKHDNFTKLSADLTNNKFIKFLLDNVQITLSEVGSEHFQRLSSGRYRFSEDGKFDVIDLNYAGQTRPSDTLSGGETFLASLGLALALAEMVGRQGGRLDAFMLDEGFGTLDPEHLDLAMEGVERLVADSDRRLVMVVSHVAELRHRVDDLLILEKDPATGDTQIVQGSSGVG